MSFIPKQEIVNIPRNHWALHPNEKELGLKTFEAIENIIARPTGRKEEILDAEGVSKRKALMRWEKFLEHPCELPDIRKWKFDSDALGAFKL